MIDFTQFPSPCYIMEEELLRKNLCLIKSVADRAGVEIILAFKSFAMWRSFPIFREYVEHSTASSVYEARLALEEFGSKAHTYSPAYTEQDFPEIMRCSSHITFNSMAQFRRFYPMTVAEGSGISCGIRVNPEYSEVETELYNPCAPGTRFGMTADLLPDTLPKGIEGFHCHCHCESSSFELERTLQHLVITTIFGLIVALILQVFYNYILSKSEALTSEMEDSSISLLDMVIKYDLKYKK